MAQISSTKFQKSFHSNAQGKWTSFYKSIKQIMALTPSTDELNFLI